MEKFYFTLDILFLNIGTFRAENKLIFYLGDNIGLCSISSRTCVVLILSVLEN